MLAVELKSQSLINLKALVVISLSSARLGLQSLQQIDLMIHSRYLTRELVQTSPSN